MLSVTYVDAMSASDREHCQKINSGNLTSGKLYEKGKMCNLREK